MFTEERQSAIENCLRENGKVKVKELSEIFQVTEDCIRKDLKILENAGKLKRTYGGAILSQDYPLKRDVVDRRQFNLDKKRTIAAKAFKLIKNNETIFLDISTTNIELAKLLATSNMRVVTTLDNHEVVKNTKLVFLAVKPQFYEEVLNEVKDELTPEHTVVGIAPGKTLAWLEEECGQPLKVVRMMPNTPAQVGEGMTGVCANEKVSAEELAQICEITDSFGRTEVVPERLMDAVSAVSGCSPAYVFMFIEAMADAAVAQGMPRKQAYQFAAQALLGSAKMVLETGMHPGELKDMVCSPAGSTIEGVRILEQKGFRSAVFEALNGAAEKGKKM